MTYQKDTIEVKDPLKNIFNIQETEVLRIDRVAPVSLDSVPVRDISEQVDSVRPSQPSQPTMAQIRYWRWQREQRLLVGDSRYIKPRNEVRLIPSSISDTSGFGLPLREINMADTDWLTILLILALVLFATVRNSYSKYLGHLLRSLTNYSTSFRMFREKNYPIIHGAYRLDFYFYVVFSVFLFQTVNFFSVGIDLSDLRLFLFCLGITVGYFLMKKLAYKFTGFITENRIIISEYLFNMANFNKAIGLFLFPVVVLNIFCPFPNQRFIIYLGIFIVVFLYLRLFYRSIIILFRKQFSIFYLFLYFCTLEFVPLVLLYKILGL